MHGINVTALTALLASKHYYTIAWYDSEYEDLHCYVNHTAETMQQTVESVTSVINNLNLGVDVDVDSFINYNQSVIYGIHGEIAAPEGFFSGQAAALDYFFETQDSNLGPSPIIFHALLDDKPIITYSPDRPDALTSASLQTPLLMSHKFNEVLYTYLMSPYK